jgi:hypothetical protein
MRRMRARLARGMVLWTLLLLAIAVVLVVQALWSLYSSQQTCFFGYPAAPCPDGRDPAVARLTLAFFGVPLVWLVGIGLAVLARPFRRRRSRSPR